MKSLVPKAGVPLFISIAVSSIQLLSGQAQVSLLPVQAATPGSNVVFPVAFQSGSVAISGLQFDLTYDPTVMTLSASLGDAANSAGKLLYTAALATNVERFLVIGMNQTALSSGTVVNLSINLNTNAAAGVSTLALSNVLATDPYGTPVSVIGINGDVSITSPSQLLLTTSISPSGSGSISASPSSAGGYYNAGTSVQLTAIPASGCVFTNWTGALSGGANPQAITMSAAQSVTANFQCGGSVSTSFVTGYALNGPPLRNNYSGWVGFTFTVGGSSINLSSLGRICVAGNNTTHTVKLVNAGSGSDVPGASVTLNMAGCTAGQFLYGAMSPITLPAGTSYDLVSLETSGGDLWYDLGTITTTNVATVSSAVYSYITSWVTYGNPNYAYGPVSFQYTTGYLLSTTVSPAGSGSISANPSSPTGAYSTGTSVQLTATPTSGCTFVNWSGALNGTANPQVVTMSAAQTVTANFQCGGSASTSFVTGYALNGPRLRNDYSGWVGMAFTIGSSSVNVSSLGRICVANNNMTHTVKLVNASNGADVPGATVSLNMTGCIAGQFLYGAISPITLPAGGSYYLFTLETTGGDLWYDLGTITTTNVASVSSGAYSYITSWETYGNPNYAYGPVSFQYTNGTAAQYLLNTSVSPAGSGNIAVSPSSPGGYYNAGTSVQLTATPASGCTFTNWSGTLTGATNSQVVTMSSAQAVTANFQCGPPPVSFLTAYALNNPPLRNNFGGWVGLGFTVGPSAISISSLGRICVANNAMTHALKIVNASTGSDVPGASVSVNMAGCTAGQFVYAAMNSIGLPAGLSYYLVSQETAGGDQWYDIGTISTTSAASVSTGVYSPYAGVWDTYGPPNTAYVPVSFLYSPGPQYVLSTGVSPAGSGTVTVSPSSSGGIYSAGTSVQLTATPASGCVFTNWTGTISGSANPQTIMMSASQAVTATFQCSGSSPVSFLTAFNLNGPPLRNDYSGWVGMNFTVGSNPLAIASLGRMCIANNASTHTLKLVTASTGADVPGASVTVNMAGCTPGQFVYGVLNSITLSPGTTYYLVSLEVAGGDQWYDSGALTSTNVAAVNSSLYSYLWIWNNAYSPNTSYVPVNFQYLP
jgi:hypothetical protein